MALTSFPFDNQSTTESQYSKLFREAVGTAVTTSTDFAVSANGSGMTVTVSPGVAVVRGHCVISDATETLPIAASGATNRVDSIVLRLDPGANTITLAVVKGDNAITGPALVQTDTGIYEFLIANISVVAGVVNIAAAAVSDRRQFQAGDLLVWANSLARPVAPRLGAVGFNVAAGAWEAWTGSAWVPLGGPFKTRYFARRAGSADGFSGDSILVTATLPATAPAGLWKASARLALSTQSGGAAIGSARVTTQKTGNAEATTGVEIRMDISGVTTIQPNEQFFTHDGTANVTVRSRYNTGGSSNLATVIASATTLELEYCGPGTLG